ncbi:MAG: CAP domain-containing protein, partial [Leptospiraceae bacterium]|nr:CAP domain-containing protein [Leptospiraceae bacterium]
VKPAPSVPPVTTPSATNSSAPTAGAAVCLTAEEKRLVDLINQYRRTKGLPTLAATKSMTRVAQVHAKDLTDNRPASGMCNMHSWSAKGSWSACCYTSDHRQAKCMWKKPSELTQYRGSGFEISAGSSGAAIDAATALRVWQGSSGHNSVIVNIGMWNKPWQAFGVGMNAGYAVAWFGHEADAAGVAEVCK